MSDKSNEVWINFKADDLEGDQAEAFKMLVQAKDLFEATFPCREGYTLRFSYKGADFSRMGFCEIAKPKSADAVKQNLSAWLQARRDANLKH